MDSEFAPHTYIAGKTNNGKSTMAKRLCREWFQPAGFPVIVLDPKKDPGYQADFITDCKAEFMREVYRRAGEQIGVIIDESGKTIGAYASEMEEIATMNRELGHRAVIIGQRPAQTSKTIILNCGNLITFQSSGRDAKSLAGDYGHKEILDSVHLKKGEYLFFPSHGPMVKGNVFAGLNK